MNYLHKKKNNYSQIFYFNLFLYIISHFYELFGNSSATIVTPCDIFSINYIITMT